MKKLAARDFEDILQVRVCVQFELLSTRCANPGQCSIPVFEGLLPEPFNGMLLRLLYKTAEWHALAKLRLHTDSTLNLLEAGTKEFGRLMRQFRDKTSAEYNTVELPHGPDARNARSRSSKKKKELNLNTYKFHALADYVTTIQLFGTTDSYSTLLVSFPLVTLSNTHPLLVGRTGSPYGQTSLWADKQARRAWANCISIPPREPLRSPSNPRPHHKPSPRIWLQRPR